MSPFGMAIVVPTLELFANEFQSSYSIIQFIISAYLFGLAISQPFMGFLSDKLGRKPVMISGIILFIIASYICMTAETLSTLIIARFLQGVGGSVGTVTSRAIIRDSYSGDQAAKSLSRVTATMGMAPMCTCYWSNRTLHNGVTKRNIFDYSIDRNSDSCSSPALFARNSH